MPQNHNMACAIYHHAQINPEAQAVVCQGRSLTYGELAERSARVARRLLRGAHWNRSHGRPPRVGILASRSIDACVAMLGACWAGATYVPIGLKQPVDRILAVLAQCDLSAMVTDDEGARLLGEHLRQQLPPLLIHAGQRPLSFDGDDTELIHLEDLPAETPDQPAPMQASDTAYIIFTSGTTGVPKGVMISAGAARHYIGLISERLSLQAGDRSLDTCELSFDFSVHNIFSTWHAGAALHILPATLVMNAVKYVRQAELTVWNSVPSLAGMLRQIKALTPGSLATLRLTVFGGEQLPASTVTAWQSAAPNSQVINLYGPTEATVFCLGQSIDTPLPLTPGRDIIAIGTPLPGSEAGIIDGNGQFLADGEQGELVIAGVQLAEGYLGAPELTSRRFPILEGKRWYRTGDLAMRDDQGGYHCLGRIDNQVKVLGYRVELEEIDSHLRTISGVDLVGSVAWPMAGDMARGIVSFVNAPSIDAERLIDALKTRIPPYMLPSRVIALNDMPLNASGKVDRRALRQLLESASA